MKRNILLTTILLTPCATYSMDKQEQTIPLTIIPHKKEVNNLCLATCAMLKSFEAHDKKSHHSLIKIIEEAHCLKSADITGKEIGFYLLKQSENILPRFSFNTYSNPTVAAVFFARLDGYSADLAVKQLVSPNTTQLKHHLKTQQISRTADNARTAFGISIPQETIDAKKIPTQDSVAVTAFDTLLSQILAIIKTEPKEIKRTAKLIYYNELHIQPAPTPSNDCQTAR